MNFKINPIVLTHLVMSLPGSESLAISNSMFLNRLCVADVTVWDIEHVWQYIQDRSNLAAVIVASEELCASPYFISVMRDNIIIPNVVLPLQTSVLGRLKTFMSQRKIQKLYAFNQLVHVLEAIPTTVSISKLLMEGSARPGATDNTNNSYVPDMQPNSFQGMPPLGNAFWSNATPPQMPMMHPPGWGGYTESVMPNQNGWSGPLNPTPASFAASPVGQQNQLQALDKSVHELTQSVKGILTEVNALKVRLPAPIKTPLMVKPKRTFIKKEPKA